MDAFLSFVSTVPGSEHVIATFFYGDNGPTGLTLTRNEQLIGACDNGGVALDVHSGRVRALIPGWEAPTKSGSTLATPTSTLRGRRRPDRRPRSPREGTDCWGMIKLKRVYEPPSADDGRRVLVERLWPRGMRRDALALDDWPKQVAPSTELRRWFNHDPARWQEFQERYAAELDADPAAWQPILDAARRGVVTLLFSAHDLEHNNAVALKEYLESRKESR